MLTLAMSIVILMFLKENEKGMPLMRGLKIILMSFLKIKLSWTFILKKEFASLVMKIMMNLML